MEDYERIETVRFAPGPEWGLLSEDDQHLVMTKSFTINPNSNRVGARLIGPLLQLRAKEQMASVPVIPGVVQLPPSGQPIVVLQDGPTTGGYPRIAVIPDRDLGRFNQIRPGRNFRFAFDAVRSDPY